MTTLAARRISRRAALTGIPGLAVGACSLGGRAPTPLAVADDRAYPDATRPDLLVSTGRLAETADTPCDGPLLLDVRPIRDFETGRIPGATHVWWQDTIERNDPFYGTVLKPDDQVGSQARRHELLDLWGARSAHRIVVYDDHVSVRAARVVWFLSFLGFDQVATLDGGYAAWLAADLPEIDRPEGTPVCDPPPDRSPRTGYYLVYEQVLSRLAQGNTILLDVRTDAELRDTVDGTVRPGTIPGAVSWPWPDLVDVDRRIRPAAELANRARALGLLPSQRVILVGRFATDCALTWLALQLIGFPDTPTYDGGWGEWSTQPDSPIAWL